MKIAITGGTGFVGRYFARKLIEDGHAVVLISRGIDQRDPETRHLKGITFAPIGVDSEEKLSQAFIGCDGIAHCAGINREIGKQTYQRVHVNGTRNVVSAAKKAGVKKILFLSFLRARPNCGSTYHESKWAAEEIVRASGLDYTVIKAGVIYGKGDHMLDHLSHALYTFPIFAFVGLKDQWMRPTAVEDMTLVLEASLVNGRLSRQTVAVTGPEEMTLRAAVNKVANVVQKQPWMFRMPVWFHYAFAWIAELTMNTPLVAIAQVRILSESLVDPLPACDRLPEDILPKIMFTEQQIKKGLPNHEPFGLKDIRGFL